MGHRSKYWLEQQSRICKELKAAGMHEAAQALNSITHAYRASATINSQLTAELKELRK